MPMTTMLDSHPLAAVFPLMTDAEIAKLAADIAAHGQHEPIYLYEGKILDGRNRFKACLKAGMNPWVTQWGGIDPVAFVVSMNLRRRHLDESQRAVVAAKLAGLKHGQHPYPSGESTEQTPENTANREGPIGPSQAASHAVTIPQAASLLNVGRNSVKRARNVLQHADEAVLAAVEAGQVSVSDAAKVVRLPKPVQRAALDAVKSGAAPTLAKAAARLRRAAGPTSGDGDRRKALDLPPEPPLVTSDARGLLVPEPYLAIFAARDEFAALGRMVDELSGAVEQVAAAPAGFYLCKDLRKIAERFRQIKLMVKGAAPYTIASRKRREPKWVSQIAWRSFADDGKGIAD